MLKTIFSLAAMVGTGLAAECYGQYSNHPSVNFAWSLRDSICNHNACADSDASRGNNHYCELTLPYDAGKAVILQRNDPSGQYKNCMAGFQNIIEQCLANAKPNFSGPNPNGSWRVGDEWYWVTMSDTISTDGATPATEDVQVDNNGNDILETLTGPTQYCAGTSPGGDECINVPAGCHILVPIDNSFPKVDCSGIPNDP